MCILKLHFLMRLIRVNLAILKQTDPSSASIITFFGIKTLFYTTKFLSLYQFGSFRLVN